MKKKNAIIILIVLFAVGFASVTTTLFINGTLLFGTNSDEFEVIFTKAIVDDNDLSVTAISNDGKTITYETKELAIIGEESILDFTVKNNSTQYDANININCIGGANEGTYYELEYDLPTFVEAQNEIDGYVTARMIRSSVNEIIEELTCTLDVTAIERTEEAGPKTVITYSDTDNSGTKNIGDIVTISKEEASSEQFYIISIDETNTTMMSMYNLYVGGDLSNATGVWVNTPYENPTGLQDSAMIGYKSSGVPYKGTVAFASAEQRGTNYSDYSGSLVEVYVNNYSSYLSRTLNVQNSATLISKEELEAIVGRTLSLGNYLSSYGAPAFLYSTSYYTRSAWSTTSVWNVDTNSTFTSNNESQEHALGVRPVVTISTDLI